LNHFKTHPKPNNSQVAEHDRMPGHGTHDSSDAGAMDPNNTETWNELLRMLNQVPDEVGAMCADCCCPSVRLIVLDYEEPSSSSDERGTGKGGKWHKLETEIKCKKILPRIPRPNVTSKRIGNTAVPWSWQNEVEPLILQGIAGLDLERAI
jgi:hypothetical protein